VNSRARLLALPARLAAVPRFHRFMALSGAALLAVVFVGCWLTSIRIPDAGLLAIAVVILVAAILPLPAYWNEKGKIGLRDAALTLPWGLFLMVSLPCVVGVAGRAGMHIGLQDAFFARLDQALGVSVPSILAWASHHWLGNFIDHSYPFLFPMLLVALLLPALTGKVRQAQEFLTGNLLSFAIGMPLFALFPAVGPWYGYNFPPNPGQAICQQSLFLLRTPGPYSLQPFGVVCFPSFHVIWAVLSVYALWCFRPLRIPVLLLAGLILLSTLTLAWHYFVDVLAGILVAAAAIVLSRALSRWFAASSASA
jgi:membrane-associated phospholipid phosphatase